MAAVSVYAAGSNLVAFNSASIKRSASNLITTAQIQAPLNILSNIQADDDIAIEVDGEVLFHGVAADWTLNYSGGGVNMSIPCVDYTYKLSHMVSFNPYPAHIYTAQGGTANTITLNAGALSIDDCYNGFFIYIRSGTGSPDTSRIIDYDGATRVATVQKNWYTIPDETSEYSLYRGFWEGLDIGHAIYFLLENTPIDTSHINISTGITLDESFEVPINEMILTTIQKIATKYKCMFYLSYGKVGDTYKTYGEFDTYANMKASGDFATEHTIRDANTPIFSLSIKNNPDNSCSRVIAVKDVAGIQEIGTATIGDPPYYDKVVSVNANDITNLNTLATTHLNNFRAGMTKLDLSFRNLAVSLFNVVDLSAVCAVLNVTLPLMEFRVTDLDYSISASGIITKTTGIDPDAELWERTVREQAGEQTVANVVQAEAEYQAEEAKPVYAEVIA